MNNDRRVVITGLGAITPLGNDVETFWSNLKNGVSGVRKIEMFDTTAYDCKIGGEVRGFDPKAFFKNPKDVRRTERFAQLALAAAKMALDDSGIDIEKLRRRDRFGVIVSSGIGGLKTLQDQLTILLTKGPSRTSPFTIPMLISNMASGLISMEYGLRGPNMCIVTACATSNNAIGESWRTIKFGDADIFLAGGSEASIVAIGLAGFSAMKALSTRNDEPQRASRPFDRDRDGFVMGEGSAVLVLEEHGRARSRGAHIYAELVGYGNSNDAHHMTAPRPDGTQAARSMKRALADGHVAPTDIAYVNAHGSSTPLNDPTETLALKHVFGDHAPRLQVSSTKGYYGHALGASGAFEAAICALALERRWLPPTVNLECPADDCDLDYIPQRGREAEVEYALSNSFGFGGINAALVFRRAD